MKAVLWTRYGPPDVLQLGEVEKPFARDNELLIKVRAATVTAGDCEARNLQFPFFLGIPMRGYMGIRKPKRITILGQELSGDVEAVGQDVTQFKPGDPVVAATLFRFGAYAEYASLPESNPIFLKPDNLSYEEAATIPTGGLNAIHFVGKAMVQPGNHVLINGAGGSIGTYAIQIVKANGADVTAVDSAGKLDMLRRIGADHVIDYAQQDYTQSGETYDAIIDIVGKRSFADIARAMKPDGRLVLGNPSISTTIRGRLASSGNDRQVLSQPAGYKPDDIRMLLELIAAGKVKPIIDRVYPLEQTAEAHRYVDTGRKAGNVVIVVGEPKH